MKKTLPIICLLISLSTYIFAQKDIVKYHNLEVHGKYGSGFAKYHRVDTLKYNDMPTAVKKLFTHSTGMFVTFKTNAKTVYAKWCVTDKKMNLNLTAIANKGLDIYVKNKEGQWQYAFSRGTEEKCNEQKILENLDGFEKEILVYLPLYDEVKSLDIGVPENTTFAELQNPFKKNIIIYGSSIVHGASAGRAGMTYPAIMSRRTGLNFINYGLSGNARMEKELAHMLGDQNPDLFILDCVPNSSPEQITERTSYLVNYLREKHPNTPIILIPTIVREVSHFNETWKVRNALQIKNWKNEYEKLIKSGVKHLYYLDNEKLIGDDHEGTTDGVHPNDLGFMRMADNIQPFVIQVLKKHKII